MKHWLVKSDPGDYGFPELQRDRRTTWDGITSAWALQFLGQMKRGDQAVIYHTGKEKAVVGTAEVARGAYPDPAVGDEKLLVVDLKAQAAFARPVTLKEIKADADFGDFLLIRNSRLSVMPVTAKQWEKLLRLGGLQPE